MPADMVRQCPFDAVLNKDTALLDSSANSVPLPRGTKIRVNREEGVFGFVVVEPTGIVGVVPKEHYDTEGIKPQVLDMLRKRRSMAVLELASISDLDVDDVQQAVRELQDAGLVRISNQDNLLDEIVTATRKAI